MENGQRLVVNSCEWMVLCEGVPAHVVAHSVLGPVVTCAECVRRFGLDDAVLGDLVEVA